MVRPVRHIGPVLCFACIALITCGGNGARAADRYFALVFSSQAKPKLPRYTHVWATVVTVSNVEQPASQWRYQVDTISWFPATLVVRTFRLRPECGINLDLQRTLNLVQGQGQHVSVWGPREIPEFMYREFMIQKARLESGQVAYQAIDSFRDPDKVSDCIHSLTDMDRMHSRRAYPLSRFGDDAAEQFVRVLAKRRPPAPVDALSETVYQILNLPCNCITRRSCTSDGRFPLER